MKPSFRILRWLVVLLAAVFVIIQFFRMPRTNPAIDPSQPIESHLQVSPQVAAILDRSCNDCHSNKTRWPWYTNVAPVSWFVIGHVNDARRDLNFSSWGSYDKDKQSRRLRDMCELVQDGVMPLSTYTPLHPGSELSAEDKKAFCEWANAERARISSLGFLAAN
ncbi:MAG: heme-binding domain-containing protein [Pyrinomonadaceae bacterium]